MIYDFISKKDGATYSIELKDVREWCKRQNIPINFIYRLNGRDVEYVDFGGYTIRKATSPRISTWTAD